MPINDTYGSGPTFFARAYGAKGDGKVVNDGSITAGTFLLNSASGLFQKVHEGNIVAVKGASNSATTYNVLGAKIAQYLSPTQVLLDTAATQTSANAEVTWGTDDTAAFASAVADAAKVATAANPATIVVEPGHYLGTQAAGPFVDLGTAGATDYIDFVGTDKYSCIIDRPYSPGVLGPVVQAATHGRIANLTIKSNVSRLIHWDTSQGAFALFEDLYLPYGGGQNGISTGIASGSSQGGVGPVSLLICKSILSGAIIAVHNGSPGDGNQAIVIFQNVSFTQLGSGALQVDMTTGTGNVALFAYGNASGWWEVDPSADFLVTVADANASVLNLYTDGSIHMRYPPVGVTKYWNYIHYTPMAFKQLGVVNNTTQEAAVMVYDPVNDNLKQTTTKSDLYPVIIAAQRSAGLGSIGIGQAPMLATGAFAEVICDTGAVAVNDIIVSSTTAQQATVDNTQTDPRRILGWAIQTKGAGSSGRVRIKRNLALSY